MNETFEPGELYWRLIDPIWHELSNSFDDPEIFLDRFRSVPVNIGHLFAACWCQAEVCNGGFHQFFFNSTGVLAPEALAGFRAIGLHDWASLLEQAMQILGHPYPREQGERWARLAEPPGEQAISDLLHELDMRFYMPLNEAFDYWECAADGYAGSDGPI